MFHARTTSNPVKSMTIGAALLFTAFGGLLGQPLEADAASKSAKPVPIKALVATKLQESGGSRIAIRLAAPATKTVKVLVKTSAAPGANAATAKQDFAAKVQWVTITKGKKIGYLTPAIVNDAIDEANERLRVQLVKTTNGAKLPVAAKHRLAYATILDDDAPAAPNDAPTPAPAPVVPAVSVSDSFAQIIEGDANSMARFTVTLSAPTTVPVTVPYSLTDGSAIAGLDFAPTAPSALHFAPGTTELTVDVPVLDDNIDEDTETAPFELGAPTGATIADGSAELHVFDDEKQPGMAMSHLEIEEGNDENTILPFEIKLSHPSSKVVTVTTYTLATTATGGPNCNLIGVDFVSVAPKVITFQPGETVKVYNVKVCGDHKVEQDESFAMPLTKLTNASSSNLQGIAMINNDD